MATRRRAPKQLGLKLASPGLLTGREVTIEHIADIERLPLSVRERLRKHFDGRAGEGMVFLRDCDEVRQSLGLIGKKETA